MKLETSEEERAELMAWCTMKTEEWKSGFAPDLTDQTVWAKTVRLLRDIDTLLAEQVEHEASMAEIARLRAELDRAPPLPAEVEEMHRRISARLEEESRKAPHERAGTNFPRELLSQVTSLLSRWPGVWRPIETAPKDGMILLFAVTARNDDGKVSNWKMGSGIWLPGYADHITLSPWEWSGRQLHKYETHPTHWSPLPEPPHE